MLPHPSIHQTSTSAFEKPKKTGLLLGQLGMYRQEMRHAAKSPDLEAVINSFILLNTDLKQRPPVISGSLREKNLRSLIKSLGEHGDPIGLVESVLMLRKPLLVPNTSLHASIVERMLEHPYPISFATALIMISKTELLSSSNSQANTNLTQLAYAAELWFGNTDTLKWFDKIFDNNFTQTQFNVLATMSQQVLPDRSNIDDARLSITEYLCEILDARNESPQLKA